MARMLHSGCVGLGADRFKKRPARGEATHPTKEVLMSLQRTAFALALSLTGMVSAHAGIVSVTGNGTLIDAPASVATNVGLESNSTAFVFSEQSGFTLSSPATVDITASGSYPTAASLTPGSIAAGTVVDSTYFHFDPVGTNDSLRYNVTIEFNADILGLAILDGTLTGTDFLGAPGTTYVANNRGLELNRQDLVSVAGRTVTITGLASTASDDFRIITSAVPEPGSLALVGLALTGAALASRRRA
jgi:hypothetical protein